jgi:hypothetical protein
LLDQLLRFLGGHLGNALPFTVEDTADVRQQDQIRPRVPPALSPPGQR